MDSNRVRSVLADLRDASQAHTDLLDSLTREVGRTTWVDVTDELGRRLERVNALTREVMEEMGLPAAPPPRGGRNPDF